MFHNLTVKNIKKETSDAVSIEFEVPSELKDQFNFKSGQFLTLKKDIGGQDTRRSYSLCSSPISGKHKIVIKQIPNGIFSTFANNEIKVGNQIEVGAPIGNFFIESNTSNSKNYTLIAAGSGITPIISILKTVLTEEPSSKTNLFYGNKTPELTIFKKELEDLLIKYSNRLNVHFIYSQTKGESKFHSGRLEGRKLKKLFKKFAPAGSTDEIFMCGPQEMTNNVRELLENKFDFDPSNIHFELFTTTAKTEGKKTKPSKRTSKVVAIVNGETVEFTVKKNESILEAGLAAGFDLPFSCQGGVCGVCQCIKGSGEVDMENNIVLSEDELASGVILACQSKVLSEEVNISFE